MSLECLKISRLINLQKKLKKIKMIIVDCRKQTRRISKGEEAIINLERKEEFKKFYDKHRKISEEIIQRYDAIHDKLYGVIEKLYDNECCCDDEVVCARGERCLKKGENERLYKISEVIHGEVHKLYDDVENILVSNSELYAHKMNFYLSKVSKRNRVEFIKRETK